MDSKLLALIATIALLAGPMINSNTSAFENEFESYKLKYGKVYESEIEHSYRQSVYISNMNEIAIHNAKVGITYTKGETQFTDLTKQEFKARYLMNIPQQKSAGIELSGEPTLGSVNWVTKGGVQKVKDQGNCGSCWAFSTAGVSESWKFVKTGTLGDFSEQQLVSCNSENYGCDGGFPDNALDYYASNGICTEESYPYTSGKDGDNGPCNESSCTKDSFTISGHSKVSATVSAVKAANEISPVSVLVDANGWEHYKTGIYSDCTTQYNHAVLLVGYSGDDYWLIKNSWGTWFGNQGYIKILGGGNTCGVLDNAVVPK